MKPWLWTIVLLAGAAFMAYGQDAASVAAALDAAPAGAKIVLISSEGEIVGYSEDLSRQGIRIVVAEGFEGAATLLVTVPDGTVLHEFDVQVGGPDVVQVLGRPLGEALAAAGFGPPSFVSQGPPPGVPAGRAERPEQASGPPDDVPAGGPPEDVPGAGPPDDSPGAGPPDTPPAEGPPEDSPGGGSSDGGDDDEDGGASGSEDGERPGRGPPDSPGPP